MKIPSRLRLPAILAAAALLAGCEGRITSSEVGNPPAKGAVAGALLDQAERPAAGALVRLYPADHDPVGDAQDTILLRYLGTADAQGAFSLDAVDTGLYNVVAEDPGRGTAALIRGVRVRAEEVSRVRAGVLKPTGALLLELPDLSVREDAYVYIAGTGVAVHVHAGAGENPSVLLAGIPAGPTPPILYRPNPGETAALLAEDVPVSPGDTLPVQAFRAWAHTRRIFMDMGPSGAGVAEDVADFPVLLRLGAGGAAFAFSEASGDGRDLRFTDPDGAPLDFEIESWDSAGATAVIWVRPGVLKGGVSDQFMRMYWGNPAALPASQGVFGADLGYVGAWHMQRMQGDSLPDASPADNPLLTRGTLSADGLRPGPWGFGVELDGRERYLATGKSFPNPDVFTLSLWFNTVSDSGGKLVGFGIDPGIADTSRDRHVWMDDSGKVHFGVLPLSAGGQYMRKVISAPGRWNDGRWHHVTATLSPAGMALYMDGLKVAEDPSTTRGQPWTTGVGYWRLGFDFPFFDWPFPPSARFFKGRIDEARVSHKAHSAGWIRLCHESQKEGSAFLRFE
jgi:hypothetical protein